MQFQPTVAFAILLAAAAACSEECAAQSVPICPQAANRYCELDELQLDLSPLQMIYAPSQGVLIVNNRSEVLTIDIATHAVASHAPLKKYFTEIALSPSGHYLFATDFDGDNSGPYFGAPPPYTNYVHRLDLVTRTWESAETSYAGGAVQAVSDDQIIVKPLMQFANFVYQRWTDSVAMLPLNAPSQNDPPAFDTYGYGGSFRYLPSSGRLINGSSGSSANDIDAFRLTGSDFFTQESSQVNTPPDYGWSVVLATDGSGFYYGSHEVDPLDVTHRLREFPVTIYAASGALAFGAYDYYDAQTGQDLGPFGVTSASRAWALDPQSTDLWVYDEFPKTLRRFVQDRIFTDGFGG